MPPRQGTKKSRTGCQRCKQRKVKCDERRPVCTGCLRYPTACFYGSRNTRESENSSTSNRSKSEPIKRSTTPLALSTPYSDVPIDEQEPEQRRPLELVLLHHFETETIRTFPSWRFAYASREWLSYIVRLALENEFLLHAIFAITSLHIILVPLDASRISQTFDFERAHRIYLNMATRGQRAAISTLNKDNAEALCWSTLMMSYIAMRLLPEDKNPEVYVVSHQWLAIASAIGPMYNATLQWRSEWTSLEYLVYTVGPNFRNFSQIYDYSYGEPFRALLEFNDGVEELDNDTKETYHKAIAYVAKAFTALTVDRESYGRMGRRLFAFGPMSGETFVSFIAQERPRALAILAHHCALMKAVEEAWFFAGVAERELRGISKILPQNWQWAMEWPFAIFNEIAPLKPSWSVLDEGELTVTRELAEQQEPRGS